MVVIGEGVWRAECIAGIDIDRTDNEVQIFPVNRAEHVSYNFDTVNDTVEAYKKAVTQWKTEIEGMKG